MEQSRAIHAFSTLGHPGRMAVFRLLMRFAPQGVRPTEIAEALGLKQNTLSHHLADLAASGLVGVCCRTVLNPTLSSFRPPVLPCE